MTRERLSRLQRRILAWLLAEDRGTRGTMAAHSTANCRTKAYPCRRSPIA